MSDFGGREYNYETYERGGGHFDQFKLIAHAGDPAIDFTLPSIDGDTVALADLKGKPVVIEFGSIT